MNPNNLCTLRRLYMNPNNFCTRRKLIQAAGAFVAGGEGLHRGAVAAQPASMTVQAFDHTGAPAGKDLLSTLLFTNLDGRPFEILPSRPDDGQAEMAVPGERFELFMLLPVRGFGQVHVYADNAGAYYSPADTSGRQLLLNFECARSRSAFVQRYMKAAAAEGVTFSPALLKRMELGGAALDRAVHANTLRARVAYSNDSLAETMWAGEMAALERARHRISHQGPRPGFLFGCDAFHLDRGEEYVRRFTELLNFATLPCLHRENERTEGMRDYSRLESALAKLAGTQVLPLGCTLVMFNEKVAMPAFMKEKSWSQLRTFIRDYIWDVVGRFRSRIHIWEIINEAHDWSNDLNLSHEQLIEATRLAAESTHAADPTAFRMVNNCLTWGEYVPRRRTYNPKRSTDRPFWTPLEYIRAIEDARVPYEAIGLQMYHPGRDMLEIERNIERFFVFGKRVHISEYGVPSSSKIDRAGSINPPSAGDIWESRNVFWHGTEWTEEIQADWLESFYTICYSKPQIDAISGWDFSDPGAIPYSGLLRSDSRPKVAYERLSKLLSEWRAEDTKRATAARYL